MITESVHYDDSGAPELLAPELDQALERARAGRGFVLLPSSTPAPMRSRRSRSASGCRRSRSRTRRRGTSAPSSSRSTGSSAAGTGEVYTYSVHYIGPSKAYKGDPPHVVALIDLDEGCG